MILTFQVIRRVSRYWIGDEPIFTLRMIMTVAMIINMFLLLAVLAMFQFTLTMPGIVAGSILVFIPAIGAFVTPVVLGGAKVLLIGNLIDRQYHTARNWPLASAMSIALMVLVSAATAIYFRTTNEQDRL